MSSSHRFLSLHWEYLIKMYLLDFVSRRMFFSLFGRSFGHFVQVVKKDVDFLKKNFSLLLGLGLIIRVLLILTFSIISIFGIIYFRTSLAHVHANEDNHIADAESDGFELEISALVMKLRPIKQGSRIQATIKIKNIIPVFESLFDEGAVREISNFAMASNESEYMLVPQKHKINFYKTTKVRVSNDFVDTIDPYHFISFPDLLARNFDTRVVFDFLGEVVSTDLMQVIVEYGREKRLMNLVAQDLSGTIIAVALWGSFAMKLNTYISQHNNDTAPVIILLRLAKLKIWGGQPQVGNCLFGSRLHINDDMPQILEFKSNLNALDTNVESSRRIHGTKGNSINTARAL
ncbi:unnamed protein product [Lactuca saligna]|uniref:Replication protein A 70 kDa DNA-binding subunit B/D first OB fold domain-containing protein n=1 Tax=Lactuca saligna TaxID=75948 RepID=A0AA36EHJ6_LACSI|nr:unnamed protein product [Lactuca saligna]